MHSKGARERKRECVCRGTERAAPREGTSEREHERECASERARERGKESLNNEIKSKKVHQREREEGGERQNRGRERACVRELRVERKNTCRERGEKFGFFLSVFFDCIQFIDL